MKNKKKLNFYYLKEAYINAKIKKIEKTVIFTIISQYRQNIQNIPQRI